MKYIIVFLLLMTTAFADELQVPGSCYPKVLQEQFREYGLKLDLSGNDRTEDSFGFIDNRGTSFNIITYRPLTRDDFNIISKILFGENYGIKK